MGEHNRGSSEPQSESKQKPGAIPEDGMQGEGNYEAARRYRKDVDGFVKSADIDKAAHDAAPKSDREAKEMAQAEEAGRERKKGS
jgi:hypothetical protein